MNLNLTPPAKISCWMHSKTIPEVQVTLAHPKARNRPRRPKITTLRRRRSHGLLAQRRQDSVCKMYGGQCSRQWRLVRFGGAESLSYQDCPPFPELASYVKWIAGSTLTAARLLVSEDLPSNTDTQESKTADAEKYDVAINWEGGRHHALRDRCSGFCYVQDVVLGIDYLRRSRLTAPATETSNGSSTRKPRIMYLDLDVHFGDAPAAAFKHPYRYSSPMTASQKRQPKPTVMTVSIHHQSPGFFPSNAEADLTLATTPNPCTVSIPLRRGASIATYARIWRTCIEPLHAAYNPDYVVLVLGMDALAGDKLVDGAANWSTEGEGGVAWCIEEVMKWGAKLLVLGGGGYHRANTARGWAIVTGTLVSELCGGSRRVLIPYSSGGPFLKMCQPMITGESIRLHSRCTYNPVCSISTLFGLLQT